MVRLEVHEANDLVLHFHTWKCKMVHAGPVQGIIQRGGGGGGGGGGGRRGSFDHPQTDELPPPRNKEQSKFLPWIEILD